MSHPPGAASSDRQRASHVLRMLRKATKTDGNPVAPSATNCACAVHCDKVGRRRKRRSLKTRKERSHARGGGGCGAADCRPCDQRQRGKGKNPSRNRCRSSAPPLRGGGLLPPMFRFAKEPSIITDGRLVGHHGLFNHEVKSLDVKRHRSEPRERDLPAHRAAQESDVAAGRAQPASRLSSSRPSCGAAVEHADEIVLTHKNADPSTCTTNTKEVCQESENPVRQSCSQASDITPGQRSPRRGDVSSDGDDVIALRTRGPPKEMTPKSEKGNSLALERERGSLLTSSGDTENVKPLKKRVKGLFDSHTPEHTPKNQGPPKHPTQPCSPSPNLPQLSSSPIAGTSEGHDAQQQGSGLDCLSNSVGAVAVRLCNSLQLPLLSRRNLVAESRGRLLKAMQKRHGPLLQENLLKVKRRLSFGPGPRAEQDKEQPTFDTDDVWPTETFSTALAISIVGQTYFDTQKAPVKRRKEQCAFGWMSTPQLNTNLNKALEWMMSPVQETGVETDVLDDWLRPGSSSQLSMNVLQPFRASSPVRLFASSPKTHWGVQASPPQPFDNTANKTRESFRLNCFNAGFLNQTQVGRGRSSWPQHIESRRGSFLHNSARLPHVDAADARHVFQEREIERLSFEKDRHSVGPTPAHFFQGRTQFCPSNHISLSPTSSLLRPRHTDLIHYPPSCMLERGHSPAIPSCSSPEHWCFPPMRLY